VSGTRRDPYRDRPEGDDSELLQAALKVQEAENRKLQAQLVALDAALEGRYVTAAEVAPAQFELRRKHACHVPQEIIDRAFGKGLVLGEDLFLKTHYVSGLVQGLRGGQRIDLAASGLSYGDPTTPTTGRGQRQTLTRAETTLPRPGTSGLPKDWTWLVTAWRLRFEHPPEERLDGIVIFEYNRNHRVQRHLLDTRDQDLLFVMRESLGYSIMIEMQSNQTITTQGRVYVEWDVIERALVG
jgi:hypothetical protein